MKISVWVQARGAAAQVARLDLPLKIPRFSSQDTQSGLKGMPASLRRRTRYGRSPTAGAGPSRAGGAGWPFAGVAPGRRLRLSVGISAARRPTRRDA